MQELGEFEIMFLRASERVLASVPSNLTFEEVSLWISALLDSYAKLRDTALLINNKRHESD